jgi:hypothetical protein
MVIIFIEHHPVLYVEKGDILTLAGGILIVLIIAIIANPHYVAVLRGSGENVSPVTPLTLPPTPLPAQTIVSRTSETPAYAEPSPSPAIPDAPPYRIFYSDKPFLYPVYKLPENMEVFGASAIVSRKDQLVPFAFVDEKRGGLTQTFSVPYPLWVLNTTVIANKTPQYGKFQMVLAYAANGTIIEGEEILYRGTSYRVVQTSNTDLYMIISTAYIDSYHISFETPRNYYDLYRPE